MTALINQAKLDKYLTNGFNVLIEGPHGVGKTEIVKQTFERAGYKWKYFSSSTLDPWVDLVGVPKATMKDGVEVLELIRPGWVIEDDVDAIFFDELNRAHSKVTNAVLELIQFKSINGHKLNKLKVIWAAINPYDEAGTYAVNELDPAMVDRFHAHIKTPYRLDADIFTRRFPETGEAFVSWWNSLSDALKAEVSPRRLEYAANAYQLEMSLDDILPRASGIAKLRAEITHGPFVKRLKKLDAANAATFFNDSNNVIALNDLLAVNHEVALKAFEDFKPKIPDELRIYRQKTKDTHDVTVVDTTVCKPFFSKFTSITAVSPWPKQEFDALLGKFLTGSPEFFQDDVRLLVQAFTGYRMAVPSKAKYVINWAVNAVAKPAALNLHVVMLIHMAKACEPIEFDSRRIAFINDRLAVQNLPTL